LCGNFFDTVLTCDQCAGGLRGSEIATRLEPEEHKPDAECEHAGPAEPANPTLNAFVLLAILRIVPDSSRAGSRRRESPEEGRVRRWFSGAGVLAFGIWLVLFGF